MYQTQAEAIAEARTVLDLGTLTMFGGMHPQDHAQTQCPVVVVMVVCTPRVNPAHLSIADLE